MSSATLTTSAVDVPGWGVRASVLRGGSGERLVWLHGLQAPSPSDPVLLALAERHEVIAPIHPGFLDLADVTNLRDVHDVALYHDDLLGALGLVAATVVGHSFGGMVAAELAADVPSRVASLVLAAPMGLWRDDDPSPDPFPADASGTLAALCYVEPESPAARRAVAAFAAVPVEEGVDPASAAMIRNVQALTTVAKFTWPIPDRGLVRRLHRIAAPTLVLWGAKDRLVPSSYVDLLTAGIARSEVAMFADAGHMAPYEEVERFRDVVDAFVGA